MRQPFSSVFILSLSLVLFAAPLTAQAASIESGFPADDHPARPVLAEPHAPGDPLPRITCADGRLAYIYTEGLSAPDGLARSPLDGAIYVAEETAGQVDRLADDGSKTVVASGLSSPEGIAFDPGGNLYGVEDAQNGRVLQVAPDGTQRVLATGRDAPEGVVYATDGHVYITESNVQFTPNPLQYRTRVTRIGLDGSLQVILSLNFFWSYSGLIQGADGYLYANNEASGVGTNDSTIRIDPRTGRRLGTLHGLVDPEGLRFAANGRLPLYIAQEDIGSGFGQITQVNPDLTTSPYCTGFYNIEDVLTTTAGPIYITEDTTGYVVILR
jgi:sugar lactone lactonase YvrE